VTRKMIQLILITDSCFFQLSCKVIGTITCFGISTYAFYERAKINTSKLGDRRFMLAIGVSFAIAGFLFSFPPTTIILKNQSWSFAIAGFFRPFIGDASLTEMPVMVLDRLRMKS
jgi:hypothetical protein